MLTRKPDLGKKLLLALGLAAAACPTALAQATATPPATAPQTTPAKLPEFDIVSIKPSLPDTPPSAQFPPDGVHLTGMSLRGLLIVAYLLPGGDIVGVPSWGETAEFDVDAKVDPSQVDAYAKLTIDQRRLMRQALLANRFKLQVHRRTREGPIYALVPTKDGAKLKAANADEETQCKVNLGRRQLSMQACPMLSIAVALSQVVARTVVDKTGLTGRYSFALDWSATGDPMSAGNGGEPSGPSIFTTIQEQLGLKLESQKGPVEDIVIDHVEMPSAN
jgi:uncharacterized protein (TIGR03435 family)